MFSILPPLLAFQGFAALILRLTLGAVFIIWAYKRFKKDGKNKKDIIGPIEGIVGVFLVVGFLTQVAAVVSAFILGNRLVSKIKTKAFLTDGVNYYFILFIISISLIFLGAGYIAFDLPL